MKKDKEQDKITIQKSPIILDLNESPIIWVRDFNFEAAEKFISKLIELESDPEISEIFIYITSYGGEVFAMLAMIEAMKNCIKPVNTVGLGINASCASVMLSAGTGDRYLTKDSFIHIHHIRTGMYDDLPAIEQNVKQTKIVEEKLIQILTDRSNMTVTQLKEKLEKEKKEWQLTANIAKKYGFIDKIGMPKIKKSIVTEIEG